MWIVDPRSWSYIVSIDNAVSASTELLAWRIGMSIRNFPLVLVLAALAGSTAAAEHTKDTPADVKKAIKDKKAILLDVREQSEWDEGHLKDAKLLPLSKLKKADAKDLDLPKDKVIYTHCRAGSRSLQAAELLQKLGFDVRALKPGYKDLLDAGFPQADK
jgi:rhodanese-related sulfurtransferase